MYINTYIHVHIYTCTYMYIILIYTHVLHSIYTCIIQCTYTGVHVHENYVQLINTKNKQAATMT